jgi:hypothetical protein
LDVEHALDALLTRLFLFFRRGWPFSGIGVVLALFAQQRTNTLLLLRFLAGHCHLLLYGLLFLPAGIVGCNLRMSFKKVVFSEIVLAGILNPLQGVVV